MNTDFAIQKLYEELVQAGEAPGSIITNVEFIDFLENIQDPEHTYIKALIFNNNRNLPETFDIHHEFRYEIGQPIIALGVETNRSDEAQNSIKVQTLINDLNAIQQYRDRHDEEHNTDEAATHLPIKLYYSDNVNTTYNFSIIYDDTSNVVFLVKDLTNTGKTWNNVREYIENVINIYSGIDQMNPICHLDSTSIIQAIEHAINNEEHQIDANNINILLSLLRPNTVQRLRTNIQNRVNAGNLSIINGQITGVVIPNNNQNQANHQNNDANQDNNQNNQDQDDELDDFIDLDNIDWDDAENFEQNNNQNNQANTNQANNQANTDQANNQANVNQTQQQNVGENCNGMRVLGEIQRTEIPANWQGDDFAIVFGGMTFDEFKRDLRIYPTTAVQTLTNKPVKYCKVDFGNPAGAKKAYLDVYRNYKFYIFESLTDIRWYQSHKGNPAFFKMSAGRTPQDMFRMLQSGRSGLEFIGFFYGRIRAEIRNGGQNIETLWASSTKFAQMTSKSQNNTDANNTTQKKQTATGKKITDYQRRKYIENIIQQRIENELVHRYTIFRPITKNSDRNVILVGRPPKTVYGRQKFSRHKITKKDAAILAKNYDDWFWIDRPNTVEAQRLLDILRRVLDPAGLEPPPPEENIILEPAEQEKLNKTLDAVNEKLDGTNIEVQITVPGYKPKYKWQPGFSSQQGNNWPTTGRFFAVMFAGIDQEKLFGNNAEQFLKTMGIWRFIQAAFEEAKKEYQDIQLAVVLDNGL